MGVRESHPPGTISWVDLMTTDVPAAKAFYGGLFGWEYEDLPAGPDQTYTMVRKDGREVCGIAGDPEGPAQWSTYVTVVNADESVAKATALGATVVMAPVDVGAAGRVALLTDPEGTYVCVWEPRERVGARLVNAHGALTWSDLMTRDVAGARRFYEAWLGWTTEEQAGGPGYVVVRNGDRMNGGMLPMTAGMGGVPSAWVPYFGIDDLDAAAAHVTGAGGRVLFGPQPVSAGRLMSFSDPQGAAFSLWEGAVED